jgi:hypothetical protein
MGAVVPKEEKNIFINNYVYYFLEHHSHNTICN